MRYVLPLLLLASPAAADCGVYTHETRPPGEVTATLDEANRRLEIRDEYAETVIYDLKSAGTGIPYEIGTAPGEESVEVREHKGDLLIDMMVYEPFCE